jgi:uncharacterized protein YkwD
MRRLRRRFPSQSQAEALESRQLLSGVSSDLSGGVLTITGTSDADQISVVVQGQNLVVVSGTEEESFNLSSVSDLVINGGGGNDLIANQSAIPATISGAAGNDTIRGGSADDVIDGGGDNDSLTGGAGRDTLVGGTGIDKLAGGSGNDELYSLSQSAGSEPTIDELRGGSGRDTIVGQSTTGIKAWGGNGKDTITGGSGDDTLYGQNGADRIDGSRGDDSIEGNGGNDDLRGGSDNDTLKGIDGDDALSGGSGADWLSGSSGADAIDGGDGADVVIGGADEDFLVGGRGKDTLTGGGADDILVAGQQAAFQNTYQAIRNEWISTRSYTERRKNIIDGSGSGTRLNGTDFIETADDGTKDVLNGTTDNDLFFANSASDATNDLTLGESLEQLGTCELNAVEQAVASLAENHILQGRTTMSCNLTLSQVARERAEDMAARSYFGHTNPDGDGPNRLVQEAGYVLPAFYSQGDAGNNIESIVAGYSNLSDAFDAWMDSSGHRAHLLGESSFYANQIEFGVGYAFDPDSPYRHYYVFLSAYRE